MPKPGSSLLPWRAGRRTSPAGAGSDPEAARRLVLRAVVEKARLVEDSRQVARILRQMRVHPDVRRRKLIGNGGPVSCPNSELSQWIS
jgi:hypothetical protein